MKRLNIQTQEMQLLLKEVDEFELKSNDVSLFCFDETLKDIRVNIEERKRTIIEKISLVSNPRTKVANEIVELCKDWLEARNSSKHNEDITVIDALFDRLVDFSKGFDSGEFTKGYCNELKGEYNSDNNSIIIYLDNLNKENERLDFLYVYIRTKIQASFQRCFKSRITSTVIEECMTEFCTLTFLERLSKVDEVFKFVFDYVYRILEKERYSMGYSVSRSFGKYLFDNCDSCVDWVVAYSRVARLVLKSNQKIIAITELLYPFYPSYEEAKCMNLFEDLLFCPIFPKVKFTLLNSFYDVALRILLVDDKVGYDGCACKGRYQDISELETLMVKRCPEEDCANARRQCKLCAIKRMMDNGNYPDGKNKLFFGIGGEDDYFYWRENKVECYYCPDVIKDFIDSDNEYLLDCINDHIELSNDNTKSFWLSYPPIQNWTKTNGKIHCDFAPVMNNESGNYKDAPLSKVQIIGVRDVRTALLLMSKFKFDMIFFDYLLDYTDENKVDRDYSIQFFKFISSDFKIKMDEARKKSEDAKQNGEKTKEEEEKKKLHKYEILDKLQFTVLRNRGPLDKLWIMPITGFNSPFITDLQNNNVPLISSRWHINNGVDPVTTPWQFLVKLNQFIGLQLNGCVYDMKLLLAFLTISGKNLLNRLSDNKGKEEVHFHDFQALMGAEYSNFMVRFGSRPIIRRDALIGEDGQDSSDKSVFSTYVWRKFYTDKGDDDAARREKKVLFSLHNLMQIFYQVAATMPEDRNGVLRLREVFRRMRYYIEINDLKDKLDGDEKRKELNDSLKYFANRIDSLLVEDDEKLKRKNK